MKKRKNSSINSVVSLEKVHQLLIGTASFWIPGTSDETYSPYMEQGSGSIPQSLITSFKLLL